MHGCFVTGTDTGAGKTVVAACLAASLRAEGLRVAAFKPVVTGLDEPRDPRWPPDDELLAAAAGRLPREVCLRRYGPAVSPHLAAELAGERPDAAVLAEAAHATGATADVLVVEGVGGLMVPLTLDYSVRDLAAELGLPLVIAARPGLGTINHTLLTLEAARNVGLAVAGVVLTPWPGSSSALERSNRETIAQLGEIEVRTLPPLPRAAPGLLAGAGRDAALGDWIGPAFGPSFAARPAQPSRAANSTIEESISHSTGARSSV